MPSYHVRIAFESHNSSSNALIVNVLHAEVDTLTSPPNWTSVAGDINSWLSATYGGLLSVNDHFDQIVVTDENYPGSTHGQGVVSENRAGGRPVTDTLLNPGLCMVASWTTAVAKRYGRGHSFLPPIYSSNSLQSGGNVSGTSAYWNAAIAFTNAYKAGFTAGSTSYVPEVFSRHLVNSGITPFTNHITGGGPTGRTSFLRSRVTSP